MSSKQPSSPKICAHVVSLESELPPYIMLIPNLLELINYVYVLIRSNIEILVSNLNLCNLACD